VTIAAVMRSRKVTLKPTVLGTLEKMSNSPRSSIIPLEDYSFPDAPTVNRAAAWYELVRQKFLQSRNKRTVTDDHLSRTELSTLKELIAEPECRPLLSSLNDKCRNPDESFLELLIVPPCDSAGIIECWARESGHQVLEPPSRDVLCSQLAPELPQLEGDGLLVIPRLEHWFIRHHRGLRHVSSLLKMIRQCDRPVLVSCNSWCWRYLAHVVDTDLVLPEPIAFEAFNAHRLRDWLHELSSSDGTDNVRFLDVNDGHDIMRPMISACGLKSLQTLALVFHG